MQAGKLEPDIVALLLEVEFKLGQPHQLMTMSDEVVVRNAESRLSFELLDLLDVAQQVNDFTGRLNQRGLPFCSLCAEELARMPFFLQWSSSRASSILVWLRCSRSAAASSSALNSGLTRKLIDTVFSAAICKICFLCIEDYCTTHRTPPQVLSGSHQLGGGRKNLGYSVAPAPG